MKEKKENKLLNYAVGAVVIFLVITGIVSIFSSGASKIKEIRQNSRAEKYAYYEEFITPVLMNDPDTFDDVSLADQSQLIAISIWSILSENIEPDKYEYAEDGMLMPEKEVEEAFRKLFGEETKLSHRSVDGGVEFKYSEKKKCYIIPITGITPIYTPDVLDAEEKTNSVVLTVGYLASVDYRQDAEGNMVPPEPSKYVKVTLRKGQSGEYYVAAIQNAE